MTSKDWKNFWLYYLVFASGSTIYCSTKMEVVKATNPQKQGKQKVFVSTISSLTDSRLISQFSSNDNLTKAVLKKKTKKNKSLILQPEISGDRDESDLQFPQKKWGRSTPRNFLEEKISWGPRGGLLDATASGGNPQDRAASLFKAPFVFKHRDSPVLGRRPRTGSPPHFFKVPSRDIKRKSEGRRKFQVGWIWNGDFDPNPKKLPHEGREFDPYLEVKTPLLSQKKESIPVLLNNNCSENILLPVILTETYGFNSPATYGVIIELGSKSPSQFQTSSNLGFPSTSVLKPVSDAIVSQIKQDTSPLEREYKTNCDNLIPFPKTLENKTRRIQSPQISLLQAEIAQNQESSTPSPVSEPKDSTQDTPALPSVSESIEQDPPPLESQPTDFGTPSSEEIEQKLDSLEDERSKKLERLLQLLKKNQEQQQQSLNQELGFIRVVEVPLEEKVSQPTKQKVRPSIEKPVAQFKPIGYLLGRVGYFNSSNIFSSESDAINDGLIFSGLTIAAAPFKIGAKTYLNGSIDGNIIRYGKKSEFDYNQIRFNLGIYQQLSKRMYSEIGWNNQQLFYSRDSNRFNFASGDKFLNENSFRLSVGRRDALAPKLNLGSFYEFRLSLTNPPEKRNRIINYVWLSLNYSLQQSLRIGVDYQFNLSNFLERSREDQYHRLSGSLKYRISELSSINLQSGFTLGGSTDRNIDFDGWFFSINYSWDLGQF